MLQLLVLSALSISAFAEEPALPDCTGMEGDDKAACEAAHEAAAQRAAVEVQIADLGDCDSIKKKKKVDACKATMSELQLQLAALTPVVEEEAAATRGVPSGAGQPPTTGGQNLELDVGDE